MKNVIQMFNNVNKSLVFSNKFKNVKIVKYDLNIKKLLTLNT